MKAKREKPVKKEKTTVDLYEEALVQGYSHVLSLNDKATEKKIFRAAVGHGCHEVGPIKIEEPNLVKWLDALLNRASEKIIPKVEENLQKAKAKHKEASDKLIDAVKPAEIKKLNESIVKAQKSIVFLTGLSEGNQDSFEEAIIDIATHCARGLHTHDGKLINAESRIRLFYDEASDATTFVPYVYSGNVDERKISAGFAHKPDAGETSIVFHAVFEYHGKKTSFAQLLRDNDLSAQNAFLKLGFKQESIAKLSEIFSSTGEEITYADTTIPQMQWPNKDGEGYTSIQSLPAIAVYSALSRAQRTKREKGYLKTSKIQVGSGQAQNISIFASSTSGFLTMLKCEPPSISSTDDSVLQKMCYRTSLIKGSRINEKAGSDEKKGFLINIALRPSEQRERFLAGHAKNHVRQILKNLVRAREMFDAQNKEWIESVSKLSDEEKTFVLNQKMSSDQVSKISRKVIENLPNGYTSAHSKEDNAIYIEFINKYVEKEC